MFYDKANMCSISELETDIEQQHTLQEPSIDILPVVELRPFSKQVWRRERSFPEFYNRPPEINQDIEERYCPNDVLPSIVEVLTDITQSSNRVREDDQRRIRTNLHPKMPNINAAPTGKPSGIIAGFITKEDRTKTTLFLAHQEENPKSYSCRKQALNSATTRRQQQLMLNGDPLSLPDNLPNHFVYLNPLLHYKQKASLKQIKYRQSKHSSAPSDDRINHITSLPGKEMDIIGILQRRSPKPKLRPISVGKRNEDRMVNSYPMNSPVDFLQQDSRPTIIERQLCRDKAFHLQRCRRNMDIGYTSLEMLQNLQNENTLSRSLTQGEIMLKKGKDSNKTNSKSEFDIKVLAPVFEPCKKRSKILPTRKFGPDQVIIPRERAVLAPVLATLKCTLENRRKDSSGYMTAENDNQNMDGIHTEGAGCVCESPTDIPNDMEDGSDRATPTNREENEAMEQGTPELETPNKDVNYITDTSSHINSPLIDLVAKVNSNDSQGRDKAERTETKSGDCGDSESEIVKYMTDRDGVNDINNLPNQPLMSENSIIYTDITLKRRPKACAFDDEDCNKHGVDDKSDKVVVNGDKSNDSYDKQLEQCINSVAIHIGKDHTVNETDNLGKHNDNVAEYNSDVTKYNDGDVSHNDRDVSHSNPVEKLNKNLKRDNIQNNNSKHNDSDKHNTSDRHIANNSNSDKHNTSERHSANNSNSDDHSASDKYSANNKHSASDKHNSNITETPELKDQATQVDNDDVGAGNGDDEPALLPSSTFLTTHV